jgi:hypothetical protein
MDVPVSFSGIVIRHSSPDVAQKTFHQPDQNNGAVTIAPHGQKKISITLQPQEQGI